MNELYKELDFKNIISPKEMAEGIEMLGKKEISKNNLMKLFKDLYKERVNDILRIVLKKYGRRYQ